MNQQSVIVNYNSNFANGDPYNFEQACNKRLHVPEDSDVALNKLTLQRKPIVLPEDENVTIELFDQLPTNDDRTRVENGEYANLIDLRPKIDDIEATIPKGEYTKGEFINVYREEIQESIEAERNLFHANNQKQDIQIEMTGKNDEQGVYLGITNAMETVNMELTEAVGSETSQVNVELDDQIVFSPIDLNLSEWATYFGGSNTINPLSGITKSNTFKQENNQSVMYFDVNFDDNDEQQQIYVGFLNNALQSNIWVSTTTPHTTTAAPSSTVTPNVPSSFFGLNLYHDSRDITSNTDVTFSGEIYLLSNLINYQQPLTAGIPNINQGIIDYKTDGSFSKFFQGARMRKISSFEFSDTAGFVDALTLGVRIYSIVEKSGNSISTQTNEARNYYFQVLGNAAATSDGSLISGGDMVIYDSRNYNYSLPQELVEDGFLMGNYQSTRDGSSNQDLGLQPYFFMTNCSPDTQIINPRATFINTRNGANGNTPQFATGIVRYSLNTSLAPKLNQILGQGQSTNYKAYASNTTLTTNNQYTPILYPMDRGPSSGIVNLYSDNQRYNIEILSFPIRTFNTTTTDEANQGNERAIVHTTHSFINGAVTTLDNSLITLEDEPFNIKYISLNNDKPIFANSLDIKIRRADTNKLASEIVDTQMELLIQSPKKNRL